MIIFKKDNKQLLENYAAILNHEAEKTLYDKYSKLLPTYQQQITDVVGLGMQNKNAEAFAYYNDKARETRAELQNLLTELVEWNQNLAQEEATAATKLGEKRHNKQLVDWRTRPACEHRNGTVHHQSYCRSAQGDAAVDE
ncbi:MCP four helix bundle domain-containing protein [Paenibacillus thiaminolyticus]|uniref:MCP four helix bundle domain-containing protein n=1 Tax=Paenibacillus thiaminolyticus TaxID=49283 RepID=UPI002350FB06|nr:MCP four helix bundle domain-containing protein [Paenibacillus thiaminolyticus]WCR27516.1 MCP four helix bundle domain-containing protein [Paenibacillus thiaminolyticus]